MSDERTCPNPVLRADAAVLVGLLAVLENEIWTDQLDRRLLEKVRDRFVRERRLAAGAQDDDLRQAVNDMNQRLRYALGEYDEPPAPMPVPR